MIQIINSNVLIKDSRAVIVTSPINGIVEFPDLNKFKTKATVADIGQNATVSLIYPSDHGTNANKTIATGITNESGVFTINSGFSAATNEIYILEGSRRIGSSGNALMAVRTMIKWTGSGWESITQGGISINSKTTALSIMSGLVPGVFSIDVIGKIAGGVPSDIIVGGQTKIKGASITDAADLVAFALSKNQDPTLYMNYSNGVFSLKEPNDVINIISRVVGTIVAFTGDGGQAKDGAIIPKSIAFDSSGNMFILERNKNRIRRVDKTTGIITTFAGTGVSGSTFNSGSASSTQLANPSGIAFDSSDNLFIADQNNHRVLKINSAGTSVVRFAGTGVSGSTIDLNSASNTQLASPSGIAFDSSGNLFVAELSNHRVLKINSAGNSVVSFAGGVYGSIINAVSASNTKLANPSGIACDSSGNLFVVELGNHRVLKINSAGNSVVMFAGTGVSGSTFNSGSASSTQLANPSEIAFDSSGNLFVADQSNHRVLKINSTGNSVVMFAGTGVSGSTISPVSASNTQLSLPSGIAFDSSGNLFVVDQSNYRVLKINSTGTLVERNAGGGIGDNSSAKLALISNNSSVAFDSSGNMFIADRNNNRIRRVDKTTGIITTFAGTGEYGSTIDPLSALNTQLYTPTGIAFDSSGNLFISEQGNNRVLKINSAGDSVVRFAGTGVSGSAIDSVSASNTQLVTPSGIAFDSSGNLFIAEQGNNRVLKINSAGNSVVRFAGTDVSGSTIDPVSASNTQLVTPSGIAFDSSGNLFIADRGNNRVLKINSAGDSVVRFVGTGVSGSTLNPVSASNTQLVTPSGIAFDSSGNLFIAEQGNHRVLKINSAGTSVVVLAGITAVSGSTNIEGSIRSESSLLYSPINLAFDSLGNLYITDSVSVIKKVEMSKDVTS